MSTSVLQALFAAPSTIKTGRISPSRDTAEVEAQLRCIGDGAAEAGE